MSYELSPPTEWERLLIVVNPASTRFREPYVQRQLDELTKTYPHHQFLDTTGNEEADRQALEAAIHDNDCVCATGGDKTVGEAGEVLAQEQFQERGIVLAPLGTGYANDFARSLNGRLTQHSMVEVVGNGTAVPVRPIESVIVEPGGAKKHITTAMNAVGINGSGDIAHAINQAPYRQHNRQASVAQRLVSEARVLMDVVRNLKTFHAGGPFQEPQAYREITIANSSRVGNYGRLPVNAADDELYKLTLDGKGLLPVIGLLGSLLLDTAPQKPECYLAYPDILTYVLGETEGVMVHVDGDVITDSSGEPARYTEDTTFMFRQAKHPVQTLQTLSARRRAPTVR